jgi:hypothetical protein
MRVAAEGKRYEDNLEPFEQDSLEGQRETVQVRN